MTADWLYRCYFITCVPDSISPSMKGTSQWEQSRLLTEGLFQIKELQRAFTAKGHITPMILSAGLIIWRWRILNWLGKMTHIVIWHWRMCFCHTSLWPNLHFGINLAQKRFWSGFYLSLRQLFKAARRWHECIYTAIRAIYVDTGVGQRWHHLVRRSCSIMSLHRILRRLCKVCNCVKMHRNCAGRCADDILFLVL